MSSQGTQLNNSEKMHKKRVWCAATDTLKVGYLVCYDRDYGTAAESDLGRAWQVEKPKAGNINWFAGVVSQIPSKSGSAGIIEIIEPVADMLVPIYCDVTAVIGATLITLKVGSYLGGKIGEGPVIAKARQTLDTDTTNALVMCEMIGEDRSRKAQTATLAGVGPSPIIWDSCPWMEIEADPTIGVKFFDDFLSPLVMADATAQGGYYTKQDTGVTIGTSEDYDERGGVIEIANNDDDVDFGHLFLSDGVGHNLCYIAASDFKPFWWEARIKVEVLTTEIAIFCGLCEIGNSDDAGMVINTGEMKDENFLGFQTLCADTDALLPVFRADSQTKANGTSTAITANTYFKVGMYGNGTIITSYIDGVSKHAITAALIEGATFPSVTPLTLALMTQTGEASESAISLDWWRFCQLR